MSPWMTSMISIGMFAVICIDGAPARMPPRRSAASRMPTGWARPSSATVMPAKPIAVPKTAG